MKLQAALLLLSAIAECRPQFGGAGSSLPLASKKELKPKLRDNAKRVMLSYGPLLMPGVDEKKPGGGFSMDRKGLGGSTTFTSKTGLCSNCTVLLTRISFHNEDGSPAKPSNGFYVHHLLAYDNSKAARVPISSDGATGSATQAFTDRGEDSGDTETIFTTPDGKYNSGFHFRTPSLGIQYDLVNYNKTSRRVYLDLELEYLDGLIGKDAGHVMKSVQGTPKVSKSGAATTTSKTMTVTEDATIVWARGHIHAGGTEVVMTLNGKDVCTSRPTYNGAGVITEMSICPEPIGLKKGDSFALRGSYDLTKHDLRESTDGGGHMGTASDTMVMWALSYAFEGK
ncbi:hypothetical protein BT63DRAFT_472205 [Microthyrium microscopicum]|uniref:Uncharacterized protein n=1 Tax=Microthyrium microscopicum TaxID=703497 RepID=A0A6A6U849_9PEZI|nr:hypothetical protein BT63DRAFT_472205 [Microthyrium microscopicum]